MMKAIGRWSVVMGIEIRLARSADADDIARIYAPFVESTIVSFETVPPDRSQMADRLAATLTRYPWLVCEWDGRIAGYAYATKHRDRKAYQWSVDTSAYVHPEYWRRGIAGGLYRSLFGILSAQRFVNAYAGIALPNPASVALHESVGFRPVGVYRSVGYKLGAWHDVGWWELGLRNHEPSPAEPVDLVTVQGREDWRSLLTAGSSSLGSG
jgi:L-amino acid N-acyltransferase YncA